MREYLDIREINGYSIDYVDVHAAGEETVVKALLYIGTPENPQFTGPQEVEGLARHIAGSEGPSGRNSEYLFNLEEALEGLGEGSADVHVKELAGRVRRVLKERGGVEEKGGVKGGVHDEEEEVER